eukprot:SAG25_NODE_5218_length_687_cov_0.654762_1_plen_28_part_10
MTQRQQMEARFLLTKIEIDTQLFPAASG